MIQKLDKVMLKTLEAVKNVFICLSLYLLLAPEQNAQSDDIEAGLTVSSDASKVDHAIQIGVCDTGLNRQPSELNKSDVPDS